MMYYNLKKMKHTEKTQLKFTKTQRGRLIPEKKGKIAFITRQASHVTVI